MQTTKPKALVCYVSAPHAGYLQLFHKHSDAVLFILGDEFIQQFGPLKRNKAGVRPEEAATMISALGIFSDVRVLSPERVEEVRQYDVVVMPEEDISDMLAERFFAGTPIVMDGSWRLRYDMKAANASHRPECETVVSHSEFDRMLMAQAMGIAQKSPDWWRQIGSLLVRDGKVLLVAFNQHLPLEQTAYVMGDPRGNFKPGEHIDASVAAHGEVSIIAEAANRGLSTKGCDLYVTTFPCPPCAASIALAGFARLFYFEGYSRIEGAAVLVSRGTEIIRVELK
jgi:dCMP deaminase